jgi:hypothetical protein
MVGAYARIARSAIDRLVAERDVRLVAELARLLSSSADAARNE